MVNLWGFTFFLGFTSLVFSVAGSPVNKLGSREIDRRAISSVECGKDILSVANIRLAKEVACTAWKKGETIGRSSYPKLFRNAEGIKFSNKGDLYGEFPILKSGQIYSGDSQPGPHRIVVVTNSCKYAGIITHAAGSGPFGKCTSVAGMRKGKTGVNEPPLSPKPIGGKTGAKPALSLPSVPSKPMAGGAKPALSLPSGPMLGSSNDQEVTSPRRFGKGKTSGLRKPTSQKLRPPAVQIPNMSGITKSFKLT